VAEDLFRRGICLPSSSSLSLEDQLYVVQQVRAAARCRTSDRASCTSERHTDVPAMPAGASSQA
jgi:hypothetical protein